MTKSPILYGVPFSQPVRAVMWLMILKDLPFDMVLINPGSKGENGSRNPAFLAKNPAGTIPCLEEPDSGFVLGEGHAVMCYLCRKYEWTDLYPDDNRLRARVDWYLHFHHRNIREASVGLVAPKIRKDLNIAASTQTAARVTFSKALDTLETGWLADSPYLVGDRVTIADLAAYVEIGQLQAHFTNVFEFEAFPAVMAWLHNMAQIKGHDDVHVVLAALGDISVEAPAKEAIIDANKYALRRLNEVIARMRD